MFAYTIEKEREIEWKYLRNKYKNLFYFGKCELEDAKAECDYENTSQIECKNFINILKKYFKKNRKGSVDMKILENIATSYLRKKKGFSNN